MAVAASVIWPCPSHKWVGNIRSEKWEKYLQSWSRNTHRAAAENLFVEASFKWEATAPSRLHINWQPPGAPPGDKSPAGQISSASKSNDSERQRETCIRVVQRSSIWFVTAGNCANLTCTSCMISRNVECVEWQEGKLEFTFTPRPEFRLWELPQFHRLYYFPPGTGECYAVQCFAKWGGAVRV